MDSDSDLSSSFFSFSSSDNDSDSGGGGGKKLSIKTISLICAISGPVANGIVNILDKIVVSGRVHHTGSYVGVLGFLDVIIGIIIGCFGDWSKEAMTGLTWVDFIMPILSGVCLGLYTIFYFFAIEWAEASQIAGIESVYPLFVILWSFLFLNEEINDMEYLGIGLAIVGGAILSSDALKSLYKAILGSSKSCSRRNEEFLERERIIEEELQEEEEKKMQTEGYGEWWYPFKETCAKKKQKTGKSSSSSSDTTVIPESNEEDPLLDHNNNPTDIHTKGNIQEDEEDKGSDETPQKTFNWKYFRRIVFGVLPIPILMSGNDFFAKVSVGNMNHNNVSGLNSIGLGIVLSCMLFKKDVRAHYIDELKFNWFFCTFIEVISIATTYFIICGMIGLEAPIVSSLSSSRPLFVLIFETIFRVSKVPVSHCFAFKLLPIILVIAGTVIMGIYA